MKKLIIIPFLLYALSLVGQTTEFNSALRYSQNIYGGSARFTGLGGAFTALGGDVSSISLNPAGLGVYSGSQIMFTPSFQFFQSNTKTLDYTKEDFKYNFNFHNIGWVTSYRPSNDSRLTINFGIGYNQLNDYNKKSHANHLNRDRSLMTEFVNNANNGVISGAYEDLAWQTYMMNFDSTRNEYFSTVVDALNYDTVPELGVVQRNIIDSKGSLGEYFFSIAVNYAHKLYIGASLGIQRVNYEVSQTHRETERNDNIYDFHSFDFVENETHSGTGYNFKIGAIYKPTEYLRLGASVHTPTFFDLKYEWHNTMSSNFDNGDAYSQSSQTRSYTYQMTSPFRINAGLALQSSKIGLISVDYEMVDYSFMQLKEGEDDYQFISENDSIETTFQVAHNIRAGAEIKLNKFYLRGGFALYQSPYKEEFNQVQSNTQVYSGGFGYRNKSFFIDFTYSRRVWNEEKQVFSTLSNLTDSEFNQNKFILSTGFRF